MSALRHIPSEKVVEGPECFLHAVLIVILLLVGIGVLIGSHRLLHMWWM